MPWFKKDKNPPSAEISKNNPTVTISSKPHFFLVQLKRVLKLFEMPPKKINLTRWSGIAGRIGMYPNQNTLVRKAHGSIFITYFKMLLL